MRNLVTAAAITIAATAPASASTFQIFTDQAAFEAASSFTPRPISFPNQFVTVTGDDVSFLADGSIEDVIDMNDEPDTVFTFAVPILGFGAWFDLSPRGPGSGIAISATVDGSVVELQQEVSSPAFTQASFFGFLSDVPFSTFAFSEGSRLDRPVETYGLSDSLVVSQEIAQANVPLPAGLPLMLAGLGAFGVLRRRQKA